METWHFSFLGGISARCQTRSLDDLVGKKAGALLALLALSPGRTRPREEVIDLLWPEVDFDEARDRFRQILARLRKLLEPTGTTPGSVLISDRTQIGIASGHQSDVAQFQQALRSAAVATEPRTRAQHLRSALALYTGEFAPGFYLDVLLTERERLNVLAQGARERLAALEATHTTEVPLSAASIVLPQPVRTQNRFFGRQREREHLGQLLKDNRLVTLLGPGGMGKTRLAQELHSEFPASHFISMSTLRSGASIPDAIVAALSLPESNDTALTRIQAAFLEKPTLLVLDNVEQLVASSGAEAIASLLEAIPALRLLATSRIKLDLPQECVCVLAPLPDEDAIDLFVNRACLAKSTFEITDENEATIAELCSTLDGLPLAIELAAARSAVLTPQQILERLSRRFDLLADKRRDREERHTSLRAALDWGWSLLAPDVQRFFTQLCLFRGSFSLEAAEAVTGEFLAIDYLQSLADASFLVMEDDRFRLLETLREYGLEKLSKGDSDTLTRAHADFFLARATQWGPLLDGAEFAATLRHFKQEEANYLAALDRTLLLDPERGVYLCVKVSLFWPYAYWNRPSIAYLNQAIQAAEHLGITGVALNRLYQALGNVYEFLGEYASARALHQKHYAYNRAQLEKREAAGDDDEALFPLRRQIAGALHNLGNLLVNEEQLDEAEWHYKEAAARNQAIGNEDWWARNLYGLYLVCWKHGAAALNLEIQTHYFERAQGYAEKGTELCRRLKLDYHLCYQLHAQVNTLSLTHQYPRALALMEEGFALTCALEHWQFICRFLLCYSYQAIHEQRWEEAVQFQGAVAGLGQRWDVVIGTTEHAPHLRSQVNLPELLGQERYDLLYQAGFGASLESLQILAATMHAPPPQAQRQAQRQ
ncbi:ATP-binding protein [Armatimonas sp.]|uniref:ATP-binding protein n=1 Tax=Armatimonas sp. TaxID=1872638 RepID=UPI00374D3D41